VLIFGSKGVKKVKERNRKKEENRREKSLILLQHLCEKKKEK
jgi:hypothetical protein